MKQVILTKAFVWVLCTPLIFSCSNDDNSSNEDGYIDIKRNSREEAVLKQGNNSTFNLLHKMVECEKPGQNWAVSPLSLNEVLGMLANGAKDDTYTEILNIMGCGDISLEEINAAYAKLSNALPKIDRTKVNIGLANSLWLDEGFTVREDFLKMNRETYNAEVFTRALSTQKTLEEINQWCSNKTNGLILEMMEAPFDPSTKISVINALYFKGEWTEKFDKAETKTESFNNDGNTQTQVSMMHIGDEFRYMKRENYSMVELLYGKGHFGLALLLPDENVSLDECLNKLNYEEWTENVDDSMCLGFGYVDIKLPHMKQECCTEFDSILKRMGMTTAFEPEKADFSNMVTGGNINIDYIKQKINIQWDEEGTKAAAVTQSGDVYGYSSPYRKGWVDFHVDRPFAYFIRETQTGVILFMGVCKNL